MNYSIHEALARCQMCQADACTILDLSNVGVKACAKLLSEVIKHVEKPDCASFDEEVDSACQAIVVIRAIAACHRHAATARNILALEGYIGPVPVPAKLTTTGGNA